MDPASPAPKMMASRGGDFIYELDYDRQPFMEARLHLMNSERQPNLYLVGFMGTGKSTIGRLAAQKLDLQFIDSDEAIEKEQGVSIAEIFAIEGEAKFRQLEKAFIESGHPSSGCLVSCGGGLIIQPGMLELLKQKGPIVSLLATAESIYKRTKSNSNRPLLNVEDPLGTIREMLAAREPIYRQAGTEVLTDNRTISDVVAHLCRVYREESKLW